MNREGYPLPKTLLALNKPLQIEVVYFRGHLAVIITTREGVALLRPSRHSIIRFIQIMNLQVKRIIFVGRRRRSTNVYIMLYIKIWKFSGLPLAKG